MELQKYFSEKAPILQREIPEKPEKSSFTDVGKEKIEALQKSIVEIHTMVKGRENLSKQIISEGETLKSEIEGYLKENEKFQIGGADITKEKNDLRHKKIEVSELQLNEKISCWKDIALLKKELREYERELTEKQERIKTLNKMMEEN
jgi:chromosome segregation ATPase